ncbi:hypothetical protein FNV43_RR06396 [Rhamnella rubrinervis]|uniref:Uncharacterized protein n=1 Tax=Rhamnella rubrinervis TaxID=2594499 RepID=A0A8K0HCZ0_9ROSA|nr:hypothetical protein FNV43_RR06396 [Rhamnella rubrinervis]
MVVTFGFFLFDYFDEDFGACSLEIGDRRKEFRSGPKLGETGSVNSAEGRRRHKRRRFGAGEGTLGNQRDVGLNALTESQRLAGAGREVQRCPRAKLAAEAHGPHLSVRPFAWSLAEAE